MSIKILFVDVETTGLNPIENGIIQLCCIMDIDGKKVDEFNSYVKPFKSDIITKESLEINGLHEEEINGLHEQVVYMRFKKWLGKYVDEYDKNDKIHFIGYNARFDDDFLREWFKKNNDKYYGSYFFWPAIDITNLLAVKYMNERNSFKNFQLMTVAKELGIDVSEAIAHNAEYNVKVTRDLFYKMFESN